jgi:hypothetical protein
LVGAGGSRKSTEPVGLGPIDDRQRREGREIVQEERSEVKVEREGIISARVAEDASRRSVRDISVIQTRGRAKDRDE